MGEGELQENGNRRYTRPGEMPLPGESHPGQSASGNELDSIYGRSGSQNSRSNSKPPIRFMEGEDDPHVPNTNGREWEEYDETGRLRKVHRRPHFGLPGNMAQDKSPTMEDNARAAEERVRRGSSSGPTPEDIAQQKIKNRLEADRQEMRIRSYTDWAPNVVNNDWMGGLGAALVLGATGKGRAAAFAAGSAFTQGTQWFGDFVDHKGFHHDHGTELKWFSDGIVWPTTFWASAAMGNAASKVLSLNPQFSKFAGAGSILARTIPFGVALGSSVMFHSIDAATGNDKRNPTYSNWCQPAWWDSAITAGVGAAVFGKIGGVKGVLAGVGAGMAAWTGFRAFNAVNPYPSPSTEFDKSLLAIDKFQQERSIDSMEDAISRLRTFGNFGRSNLTRDPLTLFDMQHPDQIPGNIKDYLTDYFTMRCNTKSTVPELKKFAEIFQDSRHFKGAYSGTIAHALVNYEAGQRALKWGAVGVEMPLGDSIGQDTKIDLGGGALRKFVNARRELDQCIAYAKTHDGQIPEGEDPALVKPINAEQEVKMLTELRNRVDKSIQEIAGPHDNLDHVINQVKDRLSKGDVQPVNELRADTRERAKYPKFQHPTLTPMLQAKLCRDTAMIDLAMAEIAIESKIRHTPYAQGEEHKNLDFITSKMESLPHLYSESLNLLTWSRERSIAEKKVRHEIIAKCEDYIKEHPQDTAKYQAEIDIQNAEIKRIIASQEDIKHIAERAQVLYQRAKEVLLPETKYMGESLQNFLDRRPMNIQFDYTSPAAVRAAKRNGRNPIKDELEQFDNPPQVTPEQKAQEEAAQKDYEQRKAEAEQESAANQDRNATMQQAELDLANAQEEFVRANIQAEVNAWRAAHPGQLPTTGELQGIEDALRELFVYKVKTGQLKVILGPKNSSDAGQSSETTQNDGGQTGSNPQQSAPAGNAPTETSQNPAQSSYGSVQQVPQQQYFPQSDPQPVIDPKEALRDQVDQFRRDNPGQRLKPRDLAKMGRNLPRTNFRMSDRPFQPNQGSSYQPVPQQDPVPVIHQATPDQF